MDGNKERIAMVDFWTVSDSDGKPLGHGAKVGNEYFDYLKDNFAITHYVNNCIKPFITNSDKVAFKASISDGYNKLRRVLGNFICIKEAYDKEETIWFYVPDIYLFVFILLLRKGKRKIAVNVYEEYQTNKIKKWIFYIALKKIDLIFVTNVELNRSILRGVYIPDYAYNEDKYGRYRKLKKKNRVICVGTMNEKKLIREAVSVFSQNEYPLYIVGQFTSKETYEYLLSVKTNNVVIENRYVDSEEYYTLLGSSKYCLVPYDSDFYKKRTSGVIQESLFCDSIPVSNKDILDFAGVPGIGYDNIIELEKFDFNTEQDDEIYMMYDEIRKKTYSNSIIKEKVINEFEKILD